MSRVSAHLEVLLVALVMLQFPRSFWILSLWYIIIPGEYLILFNIRESNFVYYNGEQY